MLCHLPTCLVHESASNTCESTRCPPRAYETVLGHYHYPDEARLVYYEQDVNAEHTFLARRMRPKRWASWRLEPAWELIWMSTLASGISMELSPTLDRNTVLTCTQPPSTCVSTKHQSIFTVSCLTSAQCPSFLLNSSAPYTSACNMPPRDTWRSTRSRGISAHKEGGR